MSTHLGGTAKPLVVTIGLLTTFSSFAANTLISYKTDQPIELDGVAESTWLKAVPLTLVLDNLPYEPVDYKGMRETNYSIQSLYDDDFVYFFVQWDDPTKSLARYPWEKQQDNTWKRLMNPDKTGHENTYYEDKASIYWNINTRDFEKKGCDIACHMADAGGVVADVQQRSPGRKFTPRQGETIDMWHWKAVRTGLTGQFDDQYVDSTIDPVVNKNWGRKSDHQTGGGYKDNITDDQLAPAMGTRMWNEIDSYAVVPDDQVLFYDTFKPGHRLASIIVNPFTGSRGDISASGVWKDGKWMLEFKRKRVTVGEMVNEQDVQFSDLSKTYYFGVSVFDNSQINHLFSHRVLKMKFEQ